VRSAYDLLVDQTLRVVRLFHAAVRHRRPPAGLPARLRAGRARERWSVYARGGLAGHGPAELDDAAEAWRLVSFLNPISHGDSDEAVQRYRVEPYALAADVYTAKGHEGRGGWTWYTGSAGWMYQLLVGRLLGLAGTRGHAGDRAPLASGVDRVHRALSLPQHVSTTSACSNARPARARPRGSWWMASNQTDDLIHMVNDVANGTPWWKSGSPMTIGRT